MNYGDHAAEQDKTLLRKILETLVFFAIVFGFSFFVDAHVFKAYGIPSGSMESTIMTGDRVCTEKVSYHFGTAQQGDIVTFEDPEIPGRTLVKRCIATEGQTIDLQDGVVFVDGIALSEPYTQGQPTNPLTRSIVDIEFPYTIPDDHIWVMGDNRTNSQDSRYFGPIKNSSVYGRAFAVLWPLDHATLL